MLAASTLSFALPLSVYASPQVYGKLNISIESADLEGASVVNPAAEDAWELNSNASRLGIKGDVDLDVANLKAIYQAEFGIDVDEGNSSGQTFSQRNIFAGLQGGFGTLTAGKIDSPLKNAEGKVDQFNDLRGDIDNLLGGQNRVNNLIRYETPSFSGLAVTLAAAPGEQNVDTDGDGVADDGLADTKSIALTYQQGIWYAALAHDQDQAARRSVDGFSRANITRVVAQIKPGDLELGALYQRSENAASGKGEDNSWLASAAWKIERIKLKAQYGETQGDQSDEKITLAALGADYQLAKTSRAYVYGSRTERDKADLTDTSVGVGLEYKF
ncbi:porin [Alcanivorax hongdengensis A-11-3]|uniref:Porin n=1 Tax=Alcanivorax hongdengensis A-11-3 TaxID=1177179 RepID=L0WIN7_9GAMM|nr:porin [Alcanivorax hongdengensis A-11-3]